LVSWVVPGVSVANWTKSRPFNGRSATSSEVITCPRVEFAGLHGYFGGVDFHGLADRRRVEREIDFEMLVDLQANIFLFGGLETLGLHSNGVIRDGRRGTR